MACRCQERRDALRRAFAAKSMTSARKELGFVLKTATEDVTRSVNIRGLQPLKRK